MKNQSNKYKKRNKQISNNEWFKKRGSIQQQANSTHKTQHFEYKLKKTQLGCDNTRVLINTMQKHRKQIEYNTKKLANKEKLISDNK